ncbi:MAG: hypothetical protein QXH00_06450 [Candidatus Jordarchaeales archaeon]
MDEEVPLGVTVDDPEHAEFAKAVFERHRPGGYQTAGSADDLVKSYFKMDKAKWLELFTHDCAVAHLRRDASTMERLKEAYRRLTNMLDWKVEEPWHVVEQEPMGAAEAAAKALSNVYWEALKVEGWRAREGEALHEGVGRGLDFEPSRVGDAYRREFGRWMALEGLLEKYARETREAAGIDEKVAHWFACRLNVEARLNLYGKSFCRGVFTFRLLYLDCILQNLLSGGIDKRVEEALWRTFLAARDCENRRRITDLGPLLCESHIVSAIMFIDGVDRKMYAVPLGEERYLLELERRFGRRGLASLYREALGLDDPDFFRVAFKREFELTEEQRRRQRRQRDASEKFLEEIAKIIHEMLEKQGFRAKFYTESA